MYEARQNKEKVSRRIDSAGGVARQKRKIKCSNTSQLRKHIEIINDLFPNKKVIGDSGLIDNPQIEIRANDKNINGVTRTPYMCAEPNALNSLWISQRNRTYIVDGWKRRPINFKDDWLSKTHFTGFAYDDDETLPEEANKPCRVCRQWVNKNNLNINKSRITLK